MHLPNYPPLVAEVRNSTRSQRGSSLIEILIVLAVIGIFSTFAVLSIASTRASLRLQNSVRQMAGYLEKARLDAIRRHGDSTLVFTNATTYEVTMDFDGSGTVYTRAFTFESGVTIISTPLPNVTFNWRGRTSACTLTFAVQNTQGEQSWVDVSDAGDVTINSNVDVLPNANYATVSASEVASNAVVLGSAVHNNTADCTGSGPGEAGPPISGGGPTCTDTANPSSTSIRKNGGSTAQIIVNATNTGTVNVSAPVNLSVTPTSQVISGGGSASFSITSINPTRGTFAVNFISPCTTLTVLVTVTN